MKGRTTGLAAPLLAGGLALCLAGCGESVKRSFGLGKRAPDETSVVEQAPLELPPDFDLRPPAPGAERPQERAVGAQAREIVVGGAAEAEEDSAPAGGAGERSLLARAGADEADPAIRAVLNREGPVLVAADPGFVEDLMFWRREGPPPGDVVDPAAEAERLDAGAEGETPIIRRRDRAPLEGLDPF